MKGGAGNRLGWASGKGSRALSIVLGLAILTALGTLVFVWVTPRVGEAFTEFYILGPGGQATDYPVRLAVGKEGKVEVCVINREGGVVIYRVEVKLDGAVVNKAGPVRLSHNKTWQETLGFVSNRVGDRQKVEFLLYRHDRSEVYRELYLWVDVR